MGSLATEIFTENTDIKVSDINGWTLTKYRVETKSGDDYIEGNNTKHSKDWYWENPGIHIENNGLLATNTGNDTIYGTSKTGYGIYLNGGVLETGDGID